jgi:CheY-like chemotaxis protein
MAGRVLVADSVAGRLDLIKEAFELAGFSVIPAQDGVECLLKAQFERPDLVVVEANVRGMNAVQVLRVIRGRPETEALPVIVLTRSDKGGKEPAAGPGKGDELYLAKPVKLGALLEAAKSMLAARQGSGVEDVEGEPPGRKGRLPVSVTR